MGLVSVRGWEIRSCLRYSKREGGVFGFAGRCLRFLGSGNRPDSRNGIWVWLDSSCHGSVQVFWLFVLVFAFEVAFLPGECCNAHESGNCRGCGYVPAIAG